ncbi:MAG TPA: redoxin family protein, partial [Planctomycetota bacterium]|nr:redoxin family protein [Planctomycetota bacterium]
MRFSLATLVALSLLWWCGAGELAAASSLPSFGNHEWLNGQPLTPGQLKGKIAVLRFYEEGCPTCRATWVSVNKMAHPWKTDKNVMLIAVSSGCAKGAVQTYAQAVKLDDWSVLVDEDRSFEKNFGFTISLQNIYQAMFLAPDGTLTPINGKEPEMGADIQRLYDQYKGQVVWKIDPKEVPASANALWQAYEYEQWSIVMTKLPDALRSSDAAVKALGGKIDTAIKAEIKKRMDEAKAKVDAGDKWGGFKIYEAVIADFGATNDTREAVPLAQKLRQDRKVGNEFTARDTYLKGKAMFADPKQKKQGEVYLQSIVDNYKDTEAAGMAKTLLGK